MDVKTKFLIISDTHGDNIPDAHHLPVDVAIHCGDLTEESKIDEFRLALKQLKDIRAPLKIIIPGNHDFTMDGPTFLTKIARDTNDEPLDPALVRREYGEYGEAEQIFADMKQQGIHLLSEGTHRFELQNGALLTVYASPYTPSPHANWGFHYPPEHHNFDIPHNADVVITHGPPHGIMDFTDSRQRAGCPRLFGAVARAQPKLHCFGHIHEGWGAKFVTWREQLDDTPSHFTAIDNDKSTVIEKLSNLKKTKFDTPESAQDKLDRRAILETRGYAAADCSAGGGYPLHPGQTLFVNAAIEGSPWDLPTHVPWVVDIDLPHR